MELNEKAMLETVKAKAKNAILKKQIKVECPYCKSKISVTAGKSVCPACRKEIDVSFNIN